MSSTILTLEIIRQLPKAELHCHLDGFVRPPTVIELAHEQGVDLPTFDVDELRGLMTCPLDCPDLPTYLKCFDIVLKVLQYPYAISRIFYEACEDAVADGISYIELRFAPALHTRNNHSYSQILEAAIQGCLIAEQRLPITPRIICCAMRHMDPEINSDIADICWRYRHRMVVGFDLAGPESGFPPHKHVKAFRTIRRKALSVTIHAGEASGARSVQLALQCSAQRIGHGTRIFEDERVLNEVIDRRIPLEICVSSNVQTQAVQRLEDHPVKRLFDLGARTCPCTDNPTVSGVTLSGEYLLLHEKFGFTVPDVLRLIDYGFRAAFIDEGMKKRLRIEAFLRATKLLSDKGIDVSGVSGPYYARIGLTFPPRFLPPVQNPRLTVALVSQLPKCDLDCRLIGSVPLSLLYRFYTDLADDARRELPQFAAPEEFTAYCLRESDAQMREEAKGLAIALLQTEANLRAATHAILYEAFVDKVLYLELTVCPTYHTKGGLEPEAVLDVVLDEIGKFRQRHEIRASLVINANIEKASPLDVHRLAELAVAYSGRGVVGFATTTAEIGVSQMRFFEPTFAYLSENFVPVTIFAGERDPESVPCALVRGHARRISGGFQITQNESLLNDVISHNIAVLISRSKRMEVAMPGWKRSPVRFLTDFGVNLAFCSIHHGFTNLPRSEQLFQLAEQAGFGAGALLKLIDQTFSAAFIPHKEVTAYQESFWKRANVILAECGFSGAVEYAYFPV